jgi:monoamine oxidase
LNAGVRLVELDTLALELRQYVDNPWDYPGAKDLDAATAEDWMAVQRAAYDKQPEPKDPTIGMSPDTAAAFTAAVRCAFSLEPRDISFFFLLYYSALAGSFASLVDVAGGQGAAEGARFMFGSKQLVNRLLDEVGHENVLFNAPVTRIEHDSTGVRVSSGEQAFEADYVIVAMSPPASARLVYDPPLAGSEAGEQRLELCRRMGVCQGKTIKGFVRFKRPTWRTPKPQGEGLMGFFLSSGPLEVCPVSWTLDNNWDPSDVHFAQFFGRPVPKPEQPENPICRLMTFIVGDAADFWTKKSQDERALAVIAHLQHAYKFPDEDLFDETNRPANYIELDWLPLRAQGIPAPAAMMQPHTLTEFGRALRAPIGRIHWAGSETALEWCGYMNGAIESGFRVTRDIARLIDGNRGDAFDLEAPSAERLVSQSA